MSLDCETSALLHITEHFLNKSQKLKPTIYTLCVEQPLVVCI